MGEVLNYREPVARKTHVCWWCGEEVEPGEKYTKWAWAECGEIGTVRCHKECKAAWDMLEWPDRECVAFSESCRGCTCASGQCECEGGK